MVPFHACTIKVDYEVHQSLFEIHGDLYSDTGVVGILARNHPLVVKSFKFWPPAIPLVNLRKCSVNMWKVSWIPCTSFMEDHTLLICFESCINRSGHGCRVQSQFCNQLNKLVSLIKHIQPCSLLEK